MPKSGFFKLVLGVFFFFYFYEYKNRVRVDRFFLRSYLFVIIILLQYIIIIILDRPTGTKLYRYSLYIMFKCHNYGTIFDLGIKIY